MPQGKNRREIQMKTQDKENAQTFTNGYRTPKTKSLFSKNALKPVKFSSKSRYATARRLARNLRREAQDFESD